MPEPQSSLFLLQTEYIIFETKQQGTPALRLFYNPIQGVNVQYVEPSLHNQM